MNRRKEIVRRYDSYGEMFQAVAPYVIRPEGFGEVLELSIIRDDAPEDIKILHRHLCRDCDRQISLDDFILDERGSLMDENKKLYGLKWDKEDPYVREQALIYKELFDQGLFFDTPEEREIDYQRSVETFGEKRAKEIFGIE